MALSRLFGSGSTDDERVRVVAEEELERVLIGIVLPAQELVSSLILMAYQPVRWAPSSTLA